MRMCCCGRPCAWLARWQMWPWRPSVANTWPTSLLTKGSCSTPAPLSTIYPKWVHRDPSASAAPFLPFPYMFPPNCCLWAGDPSVWEDFGSRVTLSSSGEKILGSEGVVCTNEMLPDLSWLINPQVKGILTLIVIIINETYDRKWCILLMETKRNNIWFWQNLLAACRVETEVNPLVRNWYIKITLEGRVRKQ